MITTFNTAVTETASEILGKHRQKKQPWVTAEILDLCNKRRKLRKNRFEPEGSEKYKEVNNNINRCMKKASVQSLKKGKSAELTTSQQNWSKQVERMQSPLSQQSATRFGRQENGQPHGLSP